MNPDVHFAICVANEGADDLQVRKVYRVLPDENGAEHAMLRVVDDSGEDYLYPREFFLPIALPASAEAKLEEVLTAGAA